MELHLVECVHSERVKHMGANSMTPAETCLLYEATWWTAHVALPRIVREHVGHPERGVEVGVAFGGMSIWLARHHRWLRITCVDPYVPYDESDGTSRVMSDGDAVHGFVQWRFANEGHGRLDLWRMTSEQAAARVADGSQDVVFIDADHRYEAVAADIDRWRAKIRPGGLLCGHDFCESWAGVKRAVLERFPTVMVNEASTIWFTVLP
jgi:hypothetical protein